MGTIEAVDLSNVLYGYKGELKEKLRDNSVPRWLKPNSPELQSPERAIKASQSASSFLRDWKKQYRAEGRGGIVSFSINKRRAPQPVRDRIEEYMDGSTHERALDRLDPGEYFDGVFVRVRIGERGGIESVRADAHYTD